MMMLYALVAACALSGVLCDESTEKNCSKIKTQENFDFSKLVGRWHIAELSENTIRRNYGHAECATLDFQLDKDNSKKLILTIQTQTNLTKLPMVVVDEPTNPAKLYLTPNFLGNSTMPLNIVGTDYETYVIVSRCKDRRVELKTALILVKNKELVYDSVLKASKVAQKQGLNHKFCPAIMCPKLWSF